jgi:serine kinase of HPr protein (carbohydrate metabolism regulator)
MGDTEVELKSGEAVFDRIQINEVTSKFIHGHVALVIVPAKPCNIGTSLIDSANEDGISFDRIRPLILEKVVVKSKKKNQKKKDE